MLYRLLSLPYNEIWVRLKHLPGEMQKIGTESQDKGGFLPPRNVHAIVRRWS